MTQKEFRKREIAKKMKTLRLDSGCTQAQVAEKLGITYQAVSNYERGKNSIETDVLLAMCEIYGVDPISVLSQGSKSEPQYKKEKVLTMSDEAISVAKRYSMLDDHGKDAVKAILEVEQQRMEHEEQASKMEVTTEISRTIIDLDKVIPFRRSYQPASAGTGFFLGPDEFETIYVQKNDLTRRATFGVPVKGDSMEPEYHDGDVLLVERAEDIRIGEVGVFTVNGEGYVKERGAGELISLNPAYAPIPMNESIRCNGRVIGILEPEWIVEK